MDDKMSGFMKKFSVFLSYCSKESFIYGKCVSEKLNDLRKDKCAKEFAQLMQCANKASTSIKKV